MEKTIYIPLIDCVAEITNKQIVVLEDGSFIDLITKDSIDAGIIDEALLLKNLKESNMVQSVSNQKARGLLNLSDWKVIRELERMFLKDTELNQSREALRDSVIEG